MRLIDADRLKEMFKKRYCDFEDVLEMLLSDVDEQPTVDHVKHGHWIEGCSTETTNYFSCSVCNAGIYVDNSWRASHKDVSDMYCVPTF